MAKEDKDKDKFHYFLDAQKKDTEQAHLTGSQIKASGPVPSDYQLYLEEHGDAPDKPVGDSETVSLAGGTKHFYAIPPADFWRLMTPLQNQFNQLCEQFPSAQLSPLAGGAYLIEIPNYRLPVGWDVPNATIRFVAPAGYPAAQPDCFWVFPQARFAGGQLPQSANDTNPIPGYSGGVSGTWFSWHIQRWHPNQDSLLTYLNVIRQRLLPPR